MSHTGKNAVPLSVWVSSPRFNSPHTTQHPIRIAHGSQAWTVSPSLYLYVQSVAVVAAVAPASRSERSRNRSLGCQTKRRNSAVHTTENTPDSTSVVRKIPSVRDTMNCATAKLPPETSAAGQTSNACFQVPPSILTNSTTSQNGTRIDAYGSWWPTIVDSV